MKLTKICQVIRQFVGAVAPVPVPSYVPAIYACVFVWVFVGRAMEVLDLLLTFQFNSRLESFMAKFKTADLSSTGQQRGIRSLLCPLMVETFDPFDQSK